MNKVQTLWVVWQNLDNSLYYHVGTLSHYNDRYEFRYTNYGSGHRKLKDAFDNGYILHPAFPNVNKIYRSRELFPAFDRRLPSSNRSDFKAILLDLGLGESSTKMDLLQQTRGRLANDTYSFEQPLRVEDDGKLYASFFVHGMRHQNLPDNWPTWLDIDSTVGLKQEPSNPHDPNAVAVYTKGGKQIGYVPTFYSKAIYSLLEYNATPTVRVIYVNEKSAPHWWVKVNFECELPLQENTLSGELSSVINE